MCCAKFTLFLSRPLKASVLIFRDLGKRLRFDDILRPLLTWPKEIDVIHKQSTCDNNTSKPSVSRAFTELYSIDSIQLTS